ncbi:uncharacterized protein LOC111434803 [Cucurbita moschata]|uniref:Uncharacterized protein LOC111434803 n=1 Tax=Cucurbita moschata TaxID=3662 RepID=A0A6J1EMH3_CUCMO|nr:uncharacterized protein LOC111434803 [Cucurbita moschata]
MSKQMLSSHEVAGGDVTTTRSGREGGVMLQYPLLTKCNYAAWSIRMCVNLKAQGVWDAIKHGDEVEEHKDRMTLAAIYETVPEDVLLMLAEKDLAKLTTIVSGIRSLGDVVKEISVVKKFLRVVLPRFMHIATSIEHSGELQNVYYATECHNNERGEEANLMFSVDEEPRLMLAEKMPNLLMLNEEKVMVNPSIDGEDQVETSMWYLDNGASNYMIGDRAKFKKLDEKFIGNMKLCEGSIVSIQGKGSILFQCKNSDQCLFTKVYYISSLKNNIISLGQMTEEGSRVEIVGSLLRIYDRNGALLMKARW